MLYDSRRTNQQVPPPGKATMFSRLTRTLIKVLVASLIVGTILAHFGLTTDQLMQAAGLSPARLADLAREGLAWALPNVLLGSLIIVPVWFLFYLFHPPGESRD
jgi:uncharacterized protein DUF6460